MQSTSISIKNKNLYAAEVKVYSKIECQVNVKKKGKERWNLLEGVKKVM